MTPGLLDPLCPSTLWGIEGPPLDSRAAPLLAPGSGPLRAVLRKRPPLPLATPWAAAGTREGGESTRGLRRVSPGEAAGWGTEREEFGGMEGEEEGPSREGNAWSEEAARANQEAPGGGSRSPSSRIRERDCWRLSILLSSFCASLQDEELGPPVERRPAQGEVDLEEALPEQETNALFPPTSATPCDDPEASPPSPGASAVDRETIRERLEALLGSPGLEEGRAALRDLRNFSKASAAARKIMVEEGLLAVLAALLESEDAPTAELCVLTTFNLVLDREHKALAVQEGVLPPLLRVLATAQKQQVWEVAVGTLCSLSAAGPTRGVLRQAGMIPLLARLLDTGSLRTQKDATIGLFNLADDADSKRAVVGAGVVRPILTRLDALECPTEKELAALLARLVTVEEGCRAVEAAGGVSVLVGVCEGGGPRAKASAASALLSLAESGGTPVLRDLWAEGALPALVGISQRGPSRGREQATTLLGLLRSIQL